MPPDPNPEKSALWLSTQKGRYRRGPMVGFLGRDSHTGVRKGVLCRLSHNVSSHRGQQQQHHPQWRWHPSPHGSVPARVWAHTNVLSDAAKQTGLRADSILGCHGHPKLSLPHPRPADGCMRYRRVLIRPWPYSSNMGCWTALGACQSTTVPVFPPQTPPSPCSLMLLPLLPLSPCPVCPPPQLMWAVRWPQMGAVALDLLTPAGRGQQARCT